MRDKTNEFAPGLRRRRGGGCSVMKVAVMLALLLALWTGCALAG